MAPNGFTLRFFTFFYNRFGPVGLLMVPFATLTMEKVCYDTFQAYRGHDIYTNGPKAGAGGGFPSGGAGLPSFSVISVRKSAKDETTSTGTSTSIAATAAPEIKIK
ncbi:hypothetical protein B484DRAFT_430019 [Ochromonadaceae sp. CCMP2298]|nr:hypothetical protein B484DRAFT_430019 [Ochromonadaceae sp. CCMP2298]|mmetsp:Transcript_7057/g.15435  ORF Transcript_7057/g.15435 Transcript_7057/m.15435 type:complete len:106 (+) Transcript_7057:155-472(+)|eukprot:CAMPEP_0173199624 /NCGR_PEP_ID=MMETSP1141-20130122/17339_1 /TAXON_ID=483371 /ORGANISM="non described non described, Strain CCMP2298" /LENGTH=105 /DNA_ID=CAMNT_0014124535 /DNA_START=59 /DNA_END=376 /DNA_ORIENTATION=-